MNELAGEWQALFFLTLNRGGADVESGLGREMYEKREGKDKAWANSAESERIMGWVVGNGTTPPGFIRLLGEIPGVSSRFLCLRSSNRERIVR